MKITCILILFLITTPCIFTAQGEWCWTKSMANEPSFILDVAKGALNWGYCVDPQTEVLTSYTLTVVTSQIENSGSHSNLEVKFNGSKGNTAYQTVSGEFELGKEKTVPLTMKEIGEAQKIYVRLAGNEGFQCKQIILQKDNRDFKFDCLKRLEQCEPDSNAKCEMEMFENGSPMFEVTLKTSELEGAETQNQILIILRGTNGTTGPRLFTDEGMGPNQTVTQTISSKDIGKVTGYTIRLNGPGSLKPASLTVKRLIDDVKRTFEISSSNELSFPGSKESISFDESDNDNKQSGLIGKASGSSPTGSRSFSLGGLSKRSSPGNSDNLNTHNPRGGLLNTQEKQSIIKLDCKQKLFNPTPDDPIFGETYPTQDVNYKNVLASCPADCHKEIETVYGIGIHPDTSPICLSAIVDRAVSLYGGIISISILSGLKEYSVPEDFPTKLGNITVNPLKSDIIKKSYTVAKVDNVDLVDKDIRILSHDGQLAPEGRIEIRLEGKWGTICGVDNDPHSAMVICKNMGYKDGNWKSPPSGSTDFCQYFNGFDYCGATSAPIHFSGIKCELNEANFNNCTKQLADYIKCSHSQDAIISCYNQVFEPNQLIPTGIIKLEGVADPKAKEVTGRLEFFNNQKFGPVCSLGFTQISAQVACKQMGFLKGTYITDPNFAKQFQLNDNDNTEFAARDVACGGNEKDLLGCRAILKEIQCRHSLDVVISCSGGNGDITGESQFKPKVVNNPPALGKLGLSKISLKCENRATMDMFRGDPGSIFIVSCPANCIKFPITVTGVFIYTSDSNICGAAIHQGVLDKNNAGTFVLLKTFGLSRYGTSNNNDIMTTPLTQKWPSSFTLFKLNSGWENMSASMNKSGAFLTQRSWFQPQQKTHKFLLNSFIQLSASDSSIPKPDFIYYEPKPGTVFGNEYSVLEENLDLTGYSSYTLILKFKLTAFNGKLMNIFSYSGCNGFNVFITDTDLLLIGDPCGEPPLNTKFKVPLESWIVLFISYSSADNLTVKIKSEHSEPDVIKNDMKLVMKSNPSIGIGRSGTVKDNIFTGEINFVQLYSSALPLTAIPIILKQVEEREQVGDNIRLTVDGRPCVSPCISNAAGGSGRTPTLALLDQPGSLIPTANSNNIGGSGSNPIANNINSYAPGQANNIPANNKLAETGFITVIVNNNGGLNANPLNNNNNPANPNTNGNSPANNPNSGGSGTNDNPQNNSIVNNNSTNGSGATSGTGSVPIAYGTYDPSQKNNQETLIIDCTTNLMDHKFIGGGVGKLFRVHCPACSTESKVVGTGIYHPLSQICWAAVHFGVKKKTEEADVIIKLTGQMKGFNGSKSNDVDSGTMAMAEASFSVSSAAPLKTLTCLTTTAQDVEFSSAREFTKFVVNCPASCMNSNGTIYGTDTYWEGSSICLAALHVGVLSNTGGEIEIMITGEQTNFAPSSRFGINSKEHESAIRGFTFIGSKAALTVRYKEDYLGNITDKWKVIQHDTPTNPTSDNWSFYNQVRKSADGRGEQISAIFHSGQIKVPQALDFASLVALKNVDFVNGTIKFNIKTSDQNPFGIVFRFADKNNYYAIIFNQGDRNGNVKFISRVNSSTTTIQTGNIKTFKMEQWFRCTLNLEFVNMSFYVQSDNIRENKLIFANEMKDLHRGGVGFGINGSNSVWFAGFEIGELKAVKVFNKRTYNEAIGKTRERDVQGYCKENFKADVNGYNSCLNPITFCSEKCDDLVDRDIESILNYKCFKQCLYKFRQATREENTNANNVIEPTPDLYSSLRPGMKVDYMTADSMWVNGRIRLIHKYPTELIIEVSYEDLEEELHTDSVKSIENKIAKCGEKLPNRNDCVDSVKKF